MNFVEYLLVGIAIGEIKCIADKMKEMAKYEEFCREKEVEK